MNSKNSDRVLRTRSLGELLFQASGAPSTRPLFDMDIEITDAFARNGSVKLDLGLLQLSDAMSDEEQPEQEPNNNEDLAEEDAVREAEKPVSISEVIDALFDVHTILTQQKKIQVRTAASALAASNLVSSIPVQISQQSRDEQLEMFENTRKMLECLVCQDVLSDAVETSCCGSVFDKDCIERWVNERGTCPLCRESLSYSMMVPNRHVQRMANELKVTCPYCPFQCKRAELNCHKEECDNRPLDPPPAADVLVRRSLLSLARNDPFSLRSFLSGPTPREALMTQCYIRTTRGGIYELYVQDGDILIMTAQRKRQLDMSVNFGVYAAYDNLNVSPSQREVPSSQRQVGRLERNFVGSQYTIYAEEAEIGAVQYAATFGKTPRQMRVALPIVEESEGSLRSTGWNAQNREDNMLSMIDRPDESRAMNLINKPPVWVEALDAYCLDFGGRVAAASVKNFLLAHPDDLDTTIMLFGRTADRNVYSMDFAHPLTPLQAFSIALSSMDSHLVTFD